MRYFTTILHVVFLLLCLSFFQVNSAEEETPEVDLQTSLSQIKARLDNVGRKNIKISELETVQAEATLLQTRLEVCISENSEKLESVKNNITLLGDRVSNEEADIGQTRKDLNTQLSAVDKDLKRCNLLKIQTDKIAEDTLQLRQSLLKEKIFSREDSLLSALQRLSKLDDDVFETEFEAIQPIVEKLYNLLQWPLLLLSLIGSAIGIVLARFTNTLPIPPKMVSSPTFIAARRGLQRTAFVLSTLVFLLLGVGLTIVDTPPIFIRTVLFALLLFSFFGLMRGVFFPDAKSISARQIPTKLLSSLNGLFLLSTLASYFFSNEAAGRFSNSGLLYLAWLISISIAALSFIALMWVLARFLLAKKTLTPTYFIPMLAMLIVIVSAAMGYRNMANLVFFGIIFSLIVVVSVVLLLRISGEFFDSLDEGRLAWQRKLRANMSIDEDSAFPGVVWLRILFFFSIVFSSIALLMFIWGSSHQRISAMVVGLKDGITIGSVSFDLLNIVYAIVILVIVLTILPVIKNQLVADWLKHSNLSRGAIEAIQTLVGYGGVGIAVLWALYVAGVNFQNLAIIAGALSVGIGFGLQNIVNNFVSGLILLFERPIRRGDWIMVGSTEGYVKNISIRSTTIQTFARADVIVPNSELISGQVTNWMLSNTVGRLEAPVGVAYGSDVPQVIEVLEKIAKEHPDVIHNHPDFPIRALFLVFGDNSLNFELRCFVKDVDSRLRVLSEINQSIDKEFRKSQIDIPFPQRVVHLKHEQE